MTAAPNFDRVARAYRWCEYLALGPLLERTRNHHLARLASCRRALILGDGDGRFTARLLAAIPELNADAVDLSAAMLGLLESRCAAYTNRLKTHHADARTFDPPHTPDLIVTHFFLDCLTQSELDALITQLTPQLAPNALWLISDFRIPPGLIGRIARAYVRLLYLAFRVLTGLRITYLPDHELPLRRCGFAPIVIHRKLFGIITTELWQRTDAP